MRVIARMSKQADLPSYSSEYGPCACSQLRRTARKLSALYDQTLAPAGITVTQYALLVNVARAGKISRTALAAQLGMDRTTLTRNLMPLEKAGFVWRPKAKIAGNGKYVSQRKGRERCSKASLFGKRHRRPLPRS